MIRVLALACLAWVVATATAEAEIFTLSSGGKIEGELLNPQQSPRETFVIRLPGGAELTIAARQVKQVVLSNPAQAEYAAVRHQYPDTVAGQWELAEWCREKGLLAERKVHLERIIELDPDHAPARRGLGYSRFDGQWKTQTQAMTDRGYVYHKGKWVLPQEIELMQRSREQELAEKGWYVSLKRWRDWLGSNRHDEAVAEINRIDDPAALPALKQALADEPLEETRRMLILAVARIGTPAAREVLASFAIDDPALEIRLTCLDHLEGTRNPAVVAQFIQRLKDKDNPIVNRAAVALERMKDPSAIGPLIDALVTTHKETTGSSNPNGYSATFSPNGGMGTGFSTGGNARTVTYQLRNPQVLDALVALSGTNFSYDIRSWRSWHASQRKSQAIDARRD